MGKKIAITGGIGSGKSTVSAILKEMGYPVFSCDQIYGELLTDKTYINEVRNYFPTAIIEGQIDKKKLGELVFSNDEARNTLNSIAHPLVMKSLLGAMDNAQAEFVFAEVPLLFEGNFENLFDEIIVLKRALPERITSVCSRDQLNEAQVQDRIHAQFDYDSGEGQAKIEKANARLVFNDGSLDRLKEAIIRLINEMKKQ